ncbi:flagellar hook-associated protein FlgK [Sporolactobacillus sp. THM7-7]|nr:flagellar hook-associated protein FlgK [Sporolactobacillus sp. THM7-7]
MIPTFSSLNMMQRALMAQQEAIQTTGHNVSNANTEGYSRQRVNMATWLPYPAIGINSPHGAGQIGTGVNVDSVARIRDQFVDLQVRDNTNQNGYWSALSDAYSQMEDIINEPTDTGLSSVLDGFWQSLQDLAGNSGTGGTGSVVLQRGKEVTDTFNYIAVSLGKVQNNLSQQISENTNLINHYADQINELNREIGVQEANGLVTNDLYDERDTLVDKLAQLINVKVTAVESGGLPSAFAEGKYTIEIVNQNGTSYNPPAVLVNGERLASSHLNVDITGENTSVPHVSLTMNHPNGTSTVLIDSGQGGAASNRQGPYGKLQGLIDAYTVDYPSVMQSLDNMASTLAQEFNAAYENSAGYNAAAGPFFIGEDGSPDAVTAANIHVNENLNGSDITANGTANGNDLPSGDNSAAMAMADVIVSNTYNIDQDGQNVTLKGYLQSLIGQIGVNAQSADHLTSNSATMLQAAENRRSSISGVSIDEELTNLIQYQHSYSAAARVVTTLDTLLDTLINRMG